MLSTPHPTRGHMTCETSTACCGLLSASTLVVLARSVFRPVYITTSLRQGDACQGGAYGSWIGLSSERHHLMSLFMRHQMQASAVAVYTKGAYPDTRVGLCQCGPEAIRPSGVLITGSEERHQQVRGRQAAGQTEGG